MTSRPSSAAAASTAEPCFPLIYRIILTTVEPVFAALGALLAFRNPAGYLSTMTRGVSLFAPDSAFLYTELGGAWLYFAFAEAVVLRVYAGDARLWRLLCAGMLLSDAAYCHSAAQAVGGWSAWARLADWTAEDWTVFWTTAPMVTVRLLVVLGIGMRTMQRTGDGKKNLQGRLGLCQGIKRR